ncbi:MULTISPECIES: DUF3152 domain-containing protein [unclassified Aeromicrobium]|uniref:DUF3152 domain-containing protein n=1 Tax=unclassified Aeromicrobium TaxID=2633570 RepID=UPI00288C4A98|nr:MULTISPECIES: DUF3152 domain-containing protein [unclassified Aeromicrobium]
MAVTVFAAAAGTLKSQGDAPGRSVGAAPTEPVSVDGTRSYDLRPVRPKGTATTPNDVPASGSGTFTTARGDSERAGTAGRLVEYRVEVEGGLGIEVEDFARAVESTLADGRGWTNGGAYTFQRTATAPLRVVLASPKMTDRLCAPLQTRGEVSCRNGADVVINARRWTKGVPYYEDIEDYRDYVINHEVGHSLGFGHEVCPAPGRPAPVMLQQTLGLQGCTPNPWP